MKSTIPGRIVHFHPNGSEGHNLPNGMEFAPAIVVQVFENNVNLNIYTADASGEPVKVGWSISHKDDAQDGQPYWVNLPVADKTKKQNVEPLKEKQDGNNQEEGSGQKEETHT
ncbi:hypothetical protein [Flavobacterium sp.]|uniref:hypothetical protein n=1 Tax=Flavobacterium sp. TaxID=239 RepID=UPI004034522F